MGCSRTDLPLASSLTLPYLRFPKGRIILSFFKNQPTNQTKLIRNNFVYLSGIYSQNSTVWHQKHRKFVFELVRISRVPTYCEDSNISRKSTVLQQKCPTSFSSKSQSPYKKVRRWAISIKQNLRFWLVFQTSLAGNLEFLNFLYFLFFFALTAKRILERLGIQTSSSFVKI